MGKLHTISNSPATPTQLAHGEKKKKKKKNKDKGTSQEETLTYNDVLDQLGLPSLDSKKKKKKNKTKPEEDMEIGGAGDDRIVVPMEAAVGSPKKKKKHKKNKSEELIIKGKQVVFSPIVQELSPQKTIGKRQVDDDHLIPARKTKKMKLEGGGESVEPNTTPISTKTVSITSTPITTQDSPSKKKKKKKNKGQDKVMETLSDDIASPPSQKKGLKESPLVKSAKSPKAAESPKNAKQKAQSFDEDEDDLEEEEDKEEDEGADWPSTLSLQFLDRISEQLLKDDKRSFRVALKKLDWSAVVVGSHSKEECKKHFSQILSKLQVYKPLPTLVEEARDVVEKGKLVARPISAFTRFMKAYSRDNATLLKNAEPRTRFSMVAEAWKKLPEEEKEKFKDSYRRDVHAYKNNAHKAGVIKKRFPKGIKPYELWATKEYSGEAGKKPELKQAFSDLPDSTKFRYIRESLKDILEKRKKDIEEGGEEEGEKIFKKGNQFTIGPNKEELQLYLRHRQMPEMPPSRASHLYYRGLVENGKVDPLAKVMEKDMSAIFRELSPTLQAKYRDQHKKMLEEFLVKFKEWEELQDEESLLAKRLLIGPKLPTYLQQKTGQVRKPAFKKIIFPNVCQSDMSCPKFHNEPKRPPSTPLRLFTLKYSLTLDPTKFRTGREKTLECRTRWRELTEEQKAKYSSKWKELMEEYREQLLNFVGEMSKKMRAVYLGFHRRPLFDLFKEDIFDQYPNSKYPVYEISPSKKPTSPHSKSKQQTTSEGEDDSSPERSSKKLSDSFVSKSSKFEIYSSSEEEMEVPGIHPLKTPQRALGRTPVPEKQLTDSFVRNSSKFQNSSSDEEEEEEEPPVRSPKKTSSVKRTKESSSEESSEDEGIEFESKKSGSKTGFVLKGKNVKSAQKNKEEEDQQPAHKMGSFKVALKKPASKESTSSSDDDDDDDDDALPAWQMRTSMASNQQNSSEEDSD